MLCGMFCLFRCWFSNGTYFYTSLIAPLCIMLLFNLVTVFIVTRSLHSKLNVSPDYSKVKLVRIIASLSLLVGATWSIGALLSFVDSIVLQYAFAILNSLQGFLIFFVNILTSNEIRARIQKSLKSSVQSFGFSTAVTTSTPVSGTATNPNSTARTSRKTSSRSRDSTDTKQVLPDVLVRVLSRTQKYSLNKASTLKRNQSAQSILVRQRSTTLENDWEIYLPSHNANRKPGAERPVTGVPSSSSAITISTVVGSQFQSFEEVEMTGIQPQPRNGEEHLPHSVNL